MAGTRVLLPGGRLLRPWTGPPASWALPLQCIRLMERSPPPRSKSRWSRLWIVHRPRLPAFLCRPSSSPLKHSCTPTTQGGAADLLNTGLPAGAALGGYDWSK
ncbi:hypothetical protein NDU88_000774 [Pleurodeles waltl]|uniref:Uncharacterized protein n=1 Tax=Pleurodeles waltl TaxID=8319 RepID=A0AAV7SXY9_PLEWA|nr:hypothetical protein NDU88_000774 [Pleurodeles waltl]